MGILSPRGGEEIVRNCKADELANNIPSKDSSLTFYCNIPLATWGEGAHRAGEGLEVGVVMAVSLRTGIPRQSGMRDHVRILDVRAGNARVM